MSENYYDLTNFRNTIYALNITIETFYANLLFKGDGTRIIYADNGNSFRKRASHQEWNNLYLPFMNYHLESISDATDRLWWQHTANISGVWCEELQRKFRLAPIKVNYESSIFFHRSDDIHFAMQELMFDFSNETLFRPTITIDGQNVELLGVLGYNLDWEPDFEQKDWFDKNKIHSIALNFEFDYTYIKDETSGFGIPDEIIFNFGRLHDLPEDCTIDEINQFVLDRFNEKTITPGFPEHE
jgi:hypothetical protein